MVVEQEETRGVSVMMKREDGRPVMPGQRGCSGVLRGPRRDDFSPPLLSLHLLERNRKRSCPGPARNLHRTRAPR